ncbi:DUF1134 domain-containing protein [Pseudochelatococcus contaminans]|uniref:DUF1134 domain-containing protein n=1 Tax=Pseudochelatococcus contaminans TaxID=1538103 RepID=A0A7W5Z7M3_9HYPH|nr:DUF1134 domain-containing protein [Pseudochelatococcus contaminans]MBB3811335.1 hypothetical protein [Pseudochelatococcus contaminans]
MEPTRKDCAPSRTLAPNRRDLLTGVGAALALAGGFAASGPALAQQPPPPGYTPAPNNDDGFNPEEIVESGHRLFGSTSRGLALAVQNVFERWGKPNGYILGQEAAGAFFGGLRYGEGKIYTRSMGERTVFWQGPSFGLDFGGSGTRTMILVYHLPSVEQLFQRFAGVDGSAYIVAGFAVSALAGKGQPGQDVVLVPIRTGVGLKLGINIGYLKFTPQSTWNPF